jgi:hypothetical protein
MLVFLYLIVLQWDVLSSGNAVQEVAHIANGSHPGNCISVLRVSVCNGFSSRFLPSFLC